MSVSTTEQPHYRLISHFHESDLQHFAETANRTLAGIACIFLCFMTLFSLIKTVTANGCGVFDLRVTGVSFPQRPEIFVLFFSTIPTMLCVMARPLDFYELDKKVQGFFMSWGVCQTRVFMDLWTRTGSLWHMIYWNNRVGIIGAIYFIYRHWKNRSAQGSGGNTASPLESAEFARLCKRWIPSVIYLVSLIVILPVVLQITEADQSAHGIPHNSERVCNTSSENLIFYVYFDYVALVCLPLIINVIQFYYLALQADSKWRMPYRLRCYLVTFILLNVPQVVTMACIFLYKHQNNQDLTKDSRMANGILISFTAYHACFAIKPVVYTTGCNCICCGQEYLQTHPRMERVVVFWSTPQHKKKKDWEARHKVQKETENSLQTAVV